MCSNASRMNFKVSRAATAKWVIEGRAGSGQEAVSSCGLDNKSCMPFRLVLPKDDLTQYLSRASRNYKGHQARVINVEIDANCHWRHDVWVALIRCPATVALRVAARQRGACFEA
eukprot:2748029-Pleurochrysis_carterae.AAC.3